MAKLSDIFGRKPEGGTDKVIPLPAMPLRGNGQGETTVDAGARIGEENEVLRNLLTDAGRKIGELDELKEAFDRLVSPFNATLRALETEKSQTLSLSGRLDEQRAAYDKLCSEFYQVERKATQLDAESARLRSDLELARGERPAHPPPHRQRQHRHRDPRPARQAGSEPRRSAQRARPSRLRSRRGERAAPGGAQHAD